MHAYNELSAKSTRNVSINFADVFKNSNTIISHRAFHMEIFMSLVVLSFEAGYFSSLRSINGMNKINYDSKIQLTWMRCSQIHMHAEICIFLELIDEFALNLVDIVFF